MKLVTAGYIPPPSYVGARSFHENLTQFKTRHDLLLFSEHEWPGTVRLKMSPEAPFMTQVRGKPTLVKPHKFAINNLLWFTALSMARDSGYTHLLYLESDCRVGCDFWDDKVFGEYFSLGHPLICGGTCAVYNPANWSLKASQRWCELVAANFIRKNMPVATYGWKGASEKHPSCVFPNGALSIVSLAWIHELFDLTQPAVRHAHNARPFDMHLGEKVWEKFEEDSYDVVGHLNSIYSGYGDVITTLDERKAMLVSGRYCAVHHIKDEWKP